MYQRRSPIQPAHEVLNPNWGELHQAGVPLDFGDPSQELQQCRDLGLCDFSFLPKLGLKGPLVHDWLREKTIPVPEEVYGRVELGDGTLVLRVDRNELFLEDSLSGQSVARLVEQSGWASPGVYRVDRQDASILICGARAGQVLSQTCGYNFGPRRDQLVMTRVAVVACSVLPVELHGIPGFRIWCAASYGLYLWGNLLTIVHDLGGSPVGIGCLSPASRD